MERRGFIAAALSAIFVFVLYKLGWRYNRSMCLSLWPNDKRLAVDAEVLSEIKSISQDKWKILSNRRIYFGHQSVGSNIIAGIEDIMQEIPEIKLSIRETKNSNDFNKGIFAHSFLGKNGDPISKLEDFRKIMDSGIAQNIDIACFKFCYVDIVDKSDIDSIFKYYAAVMVEVKKKYPRVTFIYMTTPLKATPFGLLTNIKRILGKSVWTDADNIQRNRFNELLINNFKENIFDLARHEATSKNGEEIIFSNSGKKYFSMCPDYTDDGGHLNSTGRVLIAKQLIKYMLKVS